MDLNYIQHCQSCGAPIELEEADRVIECHYCDTKNYMVDRVPLRFILPDMLPTGLSKEDIFYIPYLRFKGHIYSCYERELEHKIIDTTQLGYGSTLLPHSLGLRPQAMKIQLLGAEHSGRFVKLTEKASEIFHKAAKLTAAFSEMKTSLFHRSFIGETISFVYLPTYFREAKLMDGVLNRVLAHNIPIELLTKLSTRKKKEWMPSFLSTSCPHCGASMNGARDTLALECFNCQSLWHVKENVFEKMSFSLVESKRAELYLPFWKINCRIDGMQMNSYADYLRFTNQPVVVKKQYETLPQYFWVPAFKIRPKYFLHFSKNLTISQIKVPEGKEVITKKHYPTTLPLAEAIQALKAILTDSVAHRVSFMPELPNIDIKTNTSELVYLPFHYLGHDLVQDHTGVTVAANILHYGRSL